jgi:2-dehydro-3-deoxy-D-arabinonate dehydratase
VLARSLPRDLTIELRIERDRGVIFEGSTSTARLRRSFEELAEFLFRELSFPAGVVLLTGTGLVPPDAVTLEPGDLVTITIPGVG